MIKINKLLVCFMLFNQMVCPEEVNEEKVKEEQEELCAKLIMLSRYPEFKLFSLPFLSAFFLKLSPKLFNNEFVYRFLNNNKVIATLPYEIIRNISSFLLSSEEKLCKDIEGKIKESLKLKGKEEKAEVSNMVFKDGQLEKLTVTIDGIKHEEVRPFIIFYNSNEGEKCRRCFIITADLFDALEQGYRAYMLDRPPDKEIFDKNIDDARKNGQVVCDFKVSEIDFIGEGCQAIFP